eukprot:s610_g2.t1
MEKEAEGVVWKPAEEMSSVPVDTPPSSTPVAVAAEEAVPEDVEAVPAAAAAPDLPVQADGDGPVEVIPDPQGPAHVQECEREYFDAGCEGALEEPVEKFTEAERLHHERAVFEQTLPQIGLSMPKFPWEQGIYAQIFGNEDLGMLPPDDAWLPVPAAMPFSAEPEEIEHAMAVDPLMRQPAVGIPVFAKHVKALCDRDFAAAQQLLWTRGLACWMAILEGSGFESQVGKYVMAKVHEGDRQAALVYIRDACGIRSPSTVLKRGKDLQQFIKWADSKSVHWWPLLEENLLGYLSGVEERSQSKFIGKNLLHAVKFFKYLFGADFEVDQVCGPLLRGRVSRVLATRDPTEQARPLTVSEVKMLEEKVRTAPNVYDRYFIGCMLFALYSRARCRAWSSMSSRLEALIALHLLPGKEPYGPICRAPGVDGSFTKRALTTAEASDMFNAYLEIEKTDRATTSHPLKATTLVWAARHGLDDRCRALLGHHTLKEHSLACYSRDMLAKPLRDLAGMILNIQNGKFDPDGTRSGWMLGAQIGSRLDKAKEDAMPAEEAAASDDGEEIVETASSDSGSTGEAPDSSDDEETFFNKQRSMLDSDEKKAVGGSLMQNRRSKIVHLRNTDENNHLQPITQCGLHGEGFQCLPEGANFDWPKCSRCFKGEPEKDRDLVEVINAGKRRRLWVTHCLFQKSECRSRDQHF